MVEQQHPAQAVQVQPHQLQVHLSHDQAVEAAVYTQVAALPEQAVLVAVEQVTEPLVLLILGAVAAVQAQLQIPAVLVVQA
jgi:hypothetical protein